MSTYPTPTRLRALLGIADVVALALAIALAHVVRFYPGHLEEKTRVLAASPGLVILALLGGWLLATASELYETDVILRRQETLARLLIAVGAWAGLLALATYVRPRWTYGRGLLFLTALFALALLFLVRRGFARWLRRRPRRPVLVVGEPEPVTRFSHELTTRASSPWRPIDAAGLPLAELRREVRRNDAALVVFAGGADDPALAADLSALNFSGVPVVAAAELWARLDERLPLESLSPAHFLHQPGYNTLHSTLFNRATRLADVALASTLLLVAAPLLALAALAIRLADGSPVLYRQERVGRLGRPFVLWKLRTMTRNAEAAGPVFAAAGDPRITRVGRVLRRLRLDELPQLWNVLRGEMSLVGPRPERPEFVARLTEELPYYPFRLAVLPGLTGWAQVNAPYAADLEGHRIKLEYDLYFIRERSPRLYLLTLLRTLSATLVGTHRGARAVPESPAPSPPRGP